MNSKSGKAMPRTKNRGFAGIKKPRQGSTQTSRQRKKLAAKNAVRTAFLHPAPTIGNKTLLTLDNGLELKTSTVGGVKRTNRGVFLMVDVKKNDLITEVVGTRIDREEADELKKSGRGSYLRRVSRYEVINGTKDPKPGEGCGQICNDGSKIHKNNAFFHQINDPIKSTDRVIIKALRDIKAGEEVLVSYGTRYWK